MKKRYLAAGILLLAFGFFAGRAGPRRGAPGSAAAGGAETAAIWTCSMHPQIRQPGPGLCPLCGMDLVPAAASSRGGDEPPRRLALSPAARRLAEVDVTPAERRPVAVDVRLAGRIEPDETRVATIAPRVGGRIDRLYANFTGIAVKAGDPLADLYSPELLAAQQELLQAGRAGALLDAARERLRLWGLTSEQVAEIERGGQVREHLAFHAPLGGVVVEKDAREGQYVEAGMPLFTVADLSTVWAVLDAYESDLAWLREGQETALEAEAYPGEPLRGTIAFIEPVVDPMTRTVRVRADVPNPGGRLKPGMFIRATVKASTAGDGTGAAPLVIPASAPLITGARAVVYVAVPGEEGAFEGREIALGPRAGDFYVVRSGLEEGERVVTSGAFKLDSSLQIQGRPSMMSPPAALAAESKAQSVCPVMGGKIDKKFYTDYQGLRIYFCCGACDAAFSAGPEKYLEAMRAAGVEPEPLPGGPHAH
ncbi:MAG TPA: efflux RND transporter periplasmic adaptor subunit [Kiritimatiellia bacterium]|nr:efflux RND transporter periplasmic adaptor subunit [Kiritimatiellia bacterium]HRZ13164.1 efflux RND transporter periplasmic adaptor subunit [Kiritimatiellia bacterium]HSA17585.1 efflux RND transporter periplasmic adaptor subunit [Kiritimatiellia bacterium]